MHPPMSRWMACGERRGRCTRKPPPAGGPSGRMSGRRGTGAAAPRHAEAARRRAPWTVIAMTACVLPTRCAKRRNRRQAMPAIRSPAIHTTGTREAGDRAMLPAAPARKRGRSTAAAMTGRRLPTPFALAASLPRALHARRVRAAHTTKRHTSTTRSSTATT